MSIQFKRSFTSGLKPDSTQIVEGELALNLPDKKMYTLNQSGEVINIGFSQEYADNTFLMLSGGSMKGRLYLKAGSLPVSGSAGLDEVVSRRYVDNQFGTNPAQTRRNIDLDGRYVQTAGGSTIQNSLILNYNPSMSGNQAMATNVKFIKDNFIIKLGDAMQGPLLLNNHPTSDWMAATKFYVDQKKQESINYTDSKYNASINYTNQQVSNTNNTTSGLQNQINTINTNISNIVIPESKAHVRWTGSNSQLTCAYTSAQIGWRLTIILNEGNNVALTTIPYHYMTQVKTTGFIYIDYGDSSDWVLRYTYTATSATSGYIVFKIEGRGSIAAVYDIY